MRKYLTIRNFAWHSVIIAAIIGLYLTSQVNYLLFHSITELACIIVACSIFLFAWNSRKVLEENYLFFIGIVFLFVGGLDFIHAISYKGMGIFADIETNVSTQIWIGTRYFQSIAILFAVSLINRRIKIGILFPVFSVIYTLLMLSIFYWNNFPVCYIEGSGLTPFKIISEYIICFFLLSSIIIIWRNKKKFSPSISSRLIASLVLLILAELSFTLYTDVYGLFNAIGHILKLFSFYLMFTAIIESGLTNPLTTLFKDLKETGDGLTQEIERRKQAEQHFRNTIEYSPFCIQIYSQDNKTLYINKAGLALRDIDSLEEHLNTPEEKRLTTETVIKVKQWEKDRQNGIPLPSPFTIDILKKDGEIRTIMGYRSEIFWEGEICTQVIFQDITDQKKSEEREKQLQNEIIASNRMAAIGQMAAGIAHEVNNPLTWIMGYLEILLENSLSEENADIVRRIQEGAKRVSSIMRRMLLFSRQREPELLSININDLIINTIELRSHDMKVNDINVSLELDSTLPKIAVDNIQIQQVFLNIILNAEMEMEEAHNSGNLIIKTEKIGNNIRISFQDNGRGIPDENLEKIFDPFFTTKDVGEGTGLGLSVSYGIITQHEGKIYAENNPGGGATFIVELPINTLPEQDTQKKQLPDRNTGASRNILVVDDEEHIRDYMGKLLEVKGYTVEFAENGEKARDLIVHNDYDVILLDVKLPGLSGIDLFEQFLSTQHDISRQVIFITGDSMSLDTVSYIVTSEIPLINKPFDSNHLFETIDRIIRNKE